MAATDGRVRSRPKDPAPQLLQLRVPSDASLPGLVSFARVIWRLTTHHLKECPMRPGTALQEYKTICEFMRLYATLRFYQLALLLGTTGAIITALISSRWSPLTTSGAGFYLHVVVTAMWLTSLFIRFVPPA